MLSGFDWFALTLVSDREKMGAPVLERPSTTGKSTLNYRLDKRGKARIDHGTPSLLRQDEPRDPDDHAPAI
jgi:hypothetical protein